MLNIISVFWIILFLYIYFETSAIVEWSKLLKLKFIKYKEYEESIKMFPDLKYPDFLAMRYDNFFIKLITCQECLCIWINIILFLFFNSFLGGWLFFSINTIASLFGIALFKFSMKRFYE
jgi:hypothetical protein